MSSRSQKGVFLGFIGVYLLFVILAPTDPTVLARYNMTQERAHLVGLAVAIPLVLIWLTAFYGLNKLQEYTAAIADTKEGPAFKLLSRGLLILVITLPILASLNSYANYIHYVNPGFFPALTIIKNYLALLISLAAFLMISRGAEGLVETLRGKAAKIPQRPGLLSVIALSSVYTWLLAVRPASPAADSSYFLPNVLLIFTLAIPYLFVWCKGLTAAYHLYVYKTRVKGRIYREGLSSLAKGIMSLILLSILLQIIMTLSVRLRVLNLTPLLLIVYVLLALTALAYGLVARGSRKLQQIEEV